MQGLEMRATADSSWLASGWALLRWFSMLLLGIALLLCLAGPRALAMVQVQPQAQPTQTQTAPTRAAVVPNPQPAARPATAAESKHTAGGPHEGIQVHGHWVIEVRNPNGTLSARREFENAIQSNGIAYLASLLAGSSSSGGFAILLNGATTTFMTSSILSFSEAGPCLPMPIPPNGTLSTGGPASGTTCLITTPPPSSGLSMSYLSDFCYLIQESVSGSIPTGPEASPCSTNLVVSAPSLGSGAQGSPAAVQLQGSILATSSSAGSVNDVETVFTACDTSTAPAGCLTNTNRAAIKLVSIFTERTLDGLNGDPVSVPYSPGQTINVSVTISFQ